MTAKIAAALFQILAVSAIAFFLFSVVPGDFYSSDQLNAQLQGRTLEQWRSAHGLDRPWPLRYARWIASCARGDFGDSIAYGMPVSRVIGPRLARTARIVSASWMIGWMLAIALAIWAARRRFGIIESAMTIANMIPEVIVVSILLWIAIGLRMPIDGPSLASIGLIVAVVPLVFLHAFRSLSSARDLNFVRVVESRGVTPSRLWGRFILPASANPLISLAGPSLAAAIGSSLVIEALTGYPGLGPLFLEAVHARDYEIVQTVIVLLAAILTFTNLAAELFLFRLDPRIRLPRYGAS